MILHLQFIQKLNVKIKPNYINEMFFIKKMIK